ncbi:MAG: chromate transporter [Candidatus Humimicrobiaceae bacterium]
MNPNSEIYNTKSPILKKIFNFFFFFFKIGFMAYGGPAMLGFIKKEIVFKHRLITEDDFNDGIALVNVIPGATNSQLVAYIGYKLKKGRGALIAFTAFIIPAFIEMLIFTIIYKTTGNLGLFMQIFKALGAVITAILLNTVIMFGSKIIKEWRLDILALITLAMLIFKFNILIILLITVVLTFLLFFINKKFWPFADKAKTRENELYKDVSFGNDRDIGTKTNKEFKEEKKVNSNTTCVSPKHQFENGKSSLCFSNDISQKEKNSLKTSTKIKTFFKTYWTFFITIILVAASLTTSFFLKRDLFLASLSLTKASVLGFGGAIPMLTIIQYDMVSVLKIFSQKQIIDALVLGQITPGPIMVTSTFIGYYISGFIGAVLCTIVAFYPSFAIFSLVAPKYESVKNNKYVKLAVKGIMGMFVGMLLFFLYSVGRESIKGYIVGAFALLSFIAIRLKVKEIYIIAAAAAISVVLYFLNIKII